MFFYDCELGYVPDNGQNDVTDGTVENYDFNWQETPEEPLQTRQTPPRGDSGE